jgi:hypothetical protein
LDKAFTSKEVYLKKLHLPMIAHCAEYAQSKGATPQQFKESLEKFFASENASYKKASDSGTASRSNVNTRTRIMFEYIKQMV